MSEVRPAEKTARSDNTPVHQSCASGQLCGEDQESDRKHNQLLYQYFGMLYTEPDVHYIFFLFACTANKPPSFFMAPGRDALMKVASDDLVGQVQAPGGACLWLGKSYLSFLVPL